MWVEPSPPATTSAPWDAAPCPNASANGGEEVRMSCTVTTADAPVSRTNAAPTASATPSSISSGTVPRMSYALKIFAYSATTACLPPSPRLPVPGRDALGRDRRTRAYRARPGTARGACTAGGEGGRPLALAEPAGVPRPGTQYPQVAPAPDLHALADVLTRRARRRLHGR